MSLFKKIANYCRRSNDKYFREMDESNRREAIHRENEQRYKDSLEACANCIYFNEYSCGNLYWCSKHDFRYALEDVERYEIQYKKVCQDFFRKL